MNFVIDLTLSRVSVAQGRASQCGIQRSEIRFLMGTQNSLFLYQAQNSPSLLFYAVMLFRLSSCKLLNSHNHNHKELRFCAKGSLRDVDSSVGC